MRFLALEANIRKLKQRFIAEGEEELLSTTRHSFAFFIPLMWIVPAGVLALVAWGAGVAAGLDIIVLSGVLYLALAGLVLAALHAFIEWRYNVVVVTTDKIVVVDHRFFFSQSIRPIPLENIATTHAGSQYLGLGNCGYVTLHLTEMAKGQSAEIRLDRLPKPDVIAGIIENARSLKGQRSPSDKGTSSQSDKVQGVQAEGTRELKQTTAGAPPPPPPPPEEGGKEETPAPRRVVLTGQGGLAQMPDGEVVEVVQPTDVLDAPSAESGEAVHTDAFDAQPGGEA
jgi:hypothetical protein